MNKKDKKTLADKYYNKGKSLYKVGKYKEAIEIESRYFFAWQGKGDALEKLGRYEDAEKCIEKAEEIINNLVN